VQEDAGDEAVPAGSPEGDDGAEAGVDLTFPELGGGRNGPVVFEVLAVVTEAPPPGPALQVEAQLHFGYLVVAFC
jgi:hypothetical protein